MTQFALDYEAKLPVSAQIGMAQADANASDSWRRVADAAILAVARRMPEFTVDDVLDELARIPNAPKTHNLSALGPRMVDVSKTLRHMVATDKFERSRRPEKKGNLHRIWHSRVYRQKQAEEP